MTRFVEERRASDEPSSEAVIAVAAHEGRSACSDRSYWSGSVKIVLAAGSVDASTIPCTMPAR